MEWIEVDKVKTTERCTWLIGRLNGKYYGIPDERKMELLTDGIKYYDITVYEASVVVEKIRRFDEGIPPEWQEAQLFPGKLPDPLMCNVSIPGTEGKFRLDLGGIRLQNIVLDRMLHQEEDNQIFGTIDADVCAYLSQFVEEKYTERVAVPSVVTTSSDDQIIENENVSEPYIHGSDTKAFSDNNRSVLYQSPKGTYPNGKFNFPAPAPVREHTSKGLNVVDGLIYIFWLALIVNFIIVLGPAIIPIIFFGLIILLFGYFPRVVGWAFAIFYLGLLVFGIAGILRRVGITGTDLQKAQERM